MLQLLAAQRVAASAAARQYHAALQHAAAAAATTTSPSRRPTLLSSSPSSSYAPPPPPPNQPRCVTTTAADHQQAQAKAKEQQQQPTNEATTPTQQQKHERASPATLGRPPRTFASRRERVTPAPPTAAVDFAPYQLKVYLSNRYTYASILHKTSPSDPGNFVASASTLGERQPRRTAGAGEGSGGGDSAAGVPSSSAGPRVSLSDSAASARVGKALAERATAAGLLSPPVPVELSTRTRGRGGGVAPRSIADPRVGAGRNPRRRFVGRLRALVEAAREAGLVVH